MDAIDRKICQIIQRDGRASSADIAAATGVSVSTANERVRRLASTGVIEEWRGVLDPTRVGAALCCFVLIDMIYAGEAAAADALRERPEVLELHHISGPHSYLAKLRVADTAALQAFLQNVVKPLEAVQRTETLLALDSIKETSAVLIASPEAEA